MLIFFLNLISLTELFWPDFLKEMKRKCVGVDHSSVLVGSNYMNLEQKRIEYTCRADLVDICHHPVVELAAVYVTSASLK